MVPCRNIAEKTLIGRHTPRPHISCEIYISFFSIFPLWVPVVFFYFLHELKL